MNRFIEYGERVIGTLIIATTALFSLVVMTGLLKLGPEWTVFADAKKAQIAFQVSLWMLSMLAWDWATPGRTLNTILEINVLSKPEEKQAAALFYSAVAIALALLIGNGAF